MGKLKVAIVEESVELSFVDDQGTCFATTMDSQTAHQLSIALLQISTKDDGNINAKPFLVCQDPQSMAIGATEQGNLCLTVGPNNMRPLQFVFSEDERVYKIIELMREVLATPRAMRFQAPH